MDQKEKEKIKDWAVILAERMQQTKPGEWEVVRVHSMELVAKRTAHWLNNNFGCPTRIKLLPHSDECAVEVQKSRKQPFAK